MTETRGGETVCEGLARYLEENGFPADGADSQRWAVVRLGPVPIVYPNIAARRRAVRIHDLHHVVTGYRTDLRGESEISAWEIGSGCSRYWAAWILSLSGLLSGVTRWPRATVRAFARGRQTQNLYPHRYEDVLDYSIDSVRGRLGLERATGTRVSDVVLLVACLPAAMVASGVVGAAWLASAPWWIRDGARRLRRTPA